MKSIKHIALILSILAVLCSSCGSDVISSPKGSSVASSDTICNGIDKGMKKVRAKRRITVADVTFFEQPVSIITVDTLIRIGDTVSLEGRWYLITD